VEEPVLGGIISGMNPQTNTTPKDFFLHLAATIALYAGAIALINLAFAVINYAFPDTLGGYFYSHAVAWPISMLVVLVPLLYVMEWLIKRDIRLNPAKDGIWIRRWRTYLTLFLAGATIVGDLIALINIYLSGEITERFLWKFLAIVVIFGVIFTYYLLEKSMKAKKTQTILIWAGIVIVIGVIIGGLTTIGSPYKQRSLRLDAQRVNDLSDIQWQVVNHWQRKGKLPQTLDELKDPIAGVMIPTDPDTKAPYEYMVKSKTNFELCGNFALKSEDTKGRGTSHYGGRDMAISMPYPHGSGQDNWVHDAGRHCFTRTIDPERYPVYPAPPVKPL